MFISLQKALLSGVGNILPFATDDTNDTESNSSSTSAVQSRRRRRSILSALKKTKTTTPTNETVMTCCDALGQLCDWIEPVGCIDEIDRKKTNWTEADCELQHPDDIREVMARYNQWYDEQVAAENAVVRIHVSLQWLLIRFPLDFFFWFDIYL